MHLKQFNFEQNIGFKKNESKLQYKLSIES